MVSIRCRARRTAEQADVPTACYPPSESVSIRCRARRTAELEVGAQSWTATLSGFYSLSCETYSGTVDDIETVPFAAFLFAVVRDVQRNLPDLGGHHSVALVSIRCRARRTAEPAANPRAAVETRAEFLFAVVRDVQRNVISRHASRLGLPWGFYSLSCETYSGTARMPGRSQRGCSSFLFAVVRDVQRNDRYRHRAHRDEPPVSIRCRARRTAEQGARRRRDLHQWFLFAVVRDVQRNSSPTSTPTTVAVSIRCRARRTAEPGGCGPCRVR